MRDYYAFGATLPGRAASSNTYRYGYQGSEKDNEITGDGNDYTTFYRALDVRLGRWFSVDPKAAEQVYLSGYCSMNNNPILHKDVLGDKIDYMSRKDKRMVKELRKHDEHFAENFRQKRKDRNNLYIYHFTNEADGKDLNLADAEATRAGEKGSEPGSSAGAKTAWQKIRFSKENVFHIHYDRARYSVEKTENKLLFSWSSASSTTVNPVNGYNQQIIIIPKPPPGMDPRTNPNLILENKTEPRDLHIDVNATVVSPTGATRPFNGGDGTGADFGETVLVTPAPGAPVDNYEYYARQIKLSYSIYLPVTTTTFFDIDQRGRSQPAKKEE